MNTSPDLESLPSLPRDDDGPVFREPWEAQAFALTLTLYQEGHFTWGEWAEHLGAEIAAARDRGEDDLGDTYYEYWVAALEKLVAGKGILTGDDINRRKQEWAQAANRTEFGKPITLDDGAKP